MNTLLTDINKVKNETLHKLTWQEIGELGLNNYGVFTYHGELKTRRQGYKREVINEWQINFKASNEYRLEFIKIQQTSENTDWALRVYNEQLETYNVQFNILAGIDFLK